MDKATLRKMMKDKRRQLASWQHQDLSRRIVNQAFEIVDWDKINSLHIYLPIEEQNEVDTRPFLRAAWQQIPDLKIATSWRDGREIKTNWLDQDLKIGKLVKPGFHFSLIIVPMLAFDGRGYRLGYGGGFYDRFLPTQADALTIGLCYEFGHQKTSLPHEAHDITLNLIVSEEHIYKF